MNRQVMPSDFEIGMSNSSVTEFGRFPCCGPVSSSPSTDSSDSFVTSDTLAFGGGRAFATTKKLVPPKISSTTHTQER